MKSKTLFKLSALLILIASIVISIVWNITNKFETDKGLIIYIVIKSIVSILLIIAVLYISSADKEPATNYIIGVSTIVVQFLPIIVKLLLNGNNPKVLITTIIVVIVLVSYAITFFGSIYANDKIKKIEPSLEGKEIPVVDVNYNDDETDTFKGAGF